MQCLWEIPMDYSSKAISHNEIESKHKLSLQAIEELSKLMRA